MCCGRRAARLVLHRSHLHPPKSNPRGGILIFVFIFVLVLHLRGLLQLPYFLVGSHGCTHGPLTGRASTHCHLAKSAWAQPRRGVMAQFRFRGSLRVPYQNRPTNKTKTSFITTPCYVQKTKQDNDLYATACFLPSYGSKAANVLFRLINCFDITQFTYEVIMRMHIVSKVDASSCLFVRPAPGPLWRSVRVGVSYARSTVHCLVHVPIRPWPCLWSVAQKALTGILRRHALRPPDVTLIEMR